MKNQQMPATPETAQPVRKPSRTAALQAEIDERDETIRLLNEALSLALDELNAVRRAA